MPIERCFFCQRIYQKGKAAFTEITSTQVPTSNRPVAKVLQHLANCIRTKLIFQPGACICSDCFKELVTYDRIMVNLLRYQNKLTAQLHSVVKKECEIFETNIEKMDEEIPQNQQPEEDQVEEVGGEGEEEFKAISDPKEYVEVNDFELIDAELIEEKYDEVDRSDENDSESENFTPSKRFNECSICFKIFKTKAILQAHLTEEHDMKVFSCSICGAVRRDEEYLELHMNLHEGKTENDCRYCPKRFSRPVNTLRHMRKHWDKKRYQCEKCGERFSQDNLLYNHRLRHEAEENPVICSICNQSFKSRKTFNHHMTIHQENRPRHQCPHCSKSFTEKYTLKVHMKTHSNIVTTPAPVQEEIVYRDSLESSSAVEGIIEDSENKEANCVICCMKFEDRTCLDQHLQDDHNVILK